MSADWALPPHVLLLGHRGASLEAPENTRPALERAMALGADGVEVDVQRTADGTLVLVHDDDWLRTAGRAASVGTTPWSEASRFDVGSWFGPSFAGVGPATLEDALETLPPRAVLNLELKSPARHPGLGRDVLAAIRRCERHPQILITSFDRQCIDALVGEEPAVELGYLANRPLRADGPVKTQALPYGAILAEPAIVAAVHAARGRVWAWTVDDPETARQLVHLGVDGLISNDPGRLRSGKTAP